MALYASVTNADSDGDKPFYCASLISTSPPSFRYVICTISAKKMPSEKSNFARFQFLASPNFWLGLFLLAVFRKALCLCRKSIRNLTSGDERVMTTAEPLRSPALTNGHGPIPGDGPIIEPTQSYDSSIFREYLLSLLPPVLGASLDELDTIFDDEFEERVSRFAAEGGVVIYVVKVRDEADGECDLQWAVD